MNDLNDFIEDDKNLVIYDKLKFNNEEDFIIDNQLYSIYRKVIDIISVPLWNESSKKYFDNFTPNFNSMFSRIYTLFKLNRDIKNILPYIIYQYKLNDDKVELLQKNFNRFKIVLNIIDIDKIEYDTPYEYINPRIVEILHEDGTIKEYDCDINDKYKKNYNGDEQDKAFENIKYTKKYKKNCKKVLFVCNNIFNMNVYIDEKDYIKKSKEINNLLNLIKLKLDDKYLIKEKRYLIMNKRRLFYVDKEYNYLSIMDFNKKTNDIDKKRITEIERLYLNRGLKLLIEKINMKKLSYGITWLQKENITDNKLSGVTGLNVKTVRKYRKNIWKDDKENLF